MTAKQKLQSHIDAFGLSDTHEERLWGDINQYTLHIAEQAVGDEMEEWGNTFERPLFNHLLSRIKTLTQTNEE